MSDLSNSLDLAIIGIETIGPGYNDLGSYGYRIYRSIKNKDEVFQVQLSDENLIKVCTNTIQQARLSNGHVGVLTLSKGLLETVTRLGIGFSVKEIPDLHGGISSAWVTASNWLDGESVDAVLLLDENAEDKSVSAVLLSSLKYARDNGKQILAVLAGTSEFSETGTHKSLGALIKTALKSGDLHPDSIGLMVTSTALDVAPEMTNPEELISSFSLKSSQSCALAGGQSRLQSVVKAVWCIQQRVIPGTGDWSAPEDPQKWMSSAFYVPVESRTWFTSAEQPDRVATTIHFTGQKPASVFIFREGKNEDLRTNPAMSQEAFFLFPITGISSMDLCQNLQNLKKDLESQTDLRRISIEKINLWQQKLNTDELVVCILGHNPAELMREIDFAINGIPAAIEKQIDWRTPIGSFLSPKPQGRNGSVTFVYPGAFNSYPGVGRDLFFLFPSLYNRLSTISKNLSNLMNEKMLYPRSMTALSSSELDEAEKKLAADPLAMLISGTSLAALYTFLLRETFDIHPTSSIGYSLGEISMMFSSGVWMQADETSAVLRTSPLFRTRLAGPQNAVRENWKLPSNNHSGDAEVIWANYVLMATPEAVNAAIKDEKQVYITHINTPRQVVIAGDPTACRRVIELLKCNSLQAPFNYALHCEAMQSEYEDLRALHTWPVFNQPGMVLYSAATYQPMPIEQQAIANQIAYGLCHQLDFPRLVNQAYANGARIFIELGAGSNCSRWVDDSLKDRPHASFSINRKGVDDHTAVLQLLAKLISHHVPVKLSAVLN